MRKCRHCESAVEEHFRFCPWCGGAQRLKIVEYFPAHRLTDADETRGLRVSRYLAKPGHVRFSIWKAYEVEAAVSLDENEARRLGGSRPSFERPSRVRERGSLTVSARTPAGCSKRSAELGYRAAQEGARFSRNAATPSRPSSDLTQRAKASSSSLSLS